MTYLTGKELFADLAVHPVVAAWRHNFNYNWRAIVNRKFLAFILAASVTAVPGLASAKGCLKGAAVGGVAGHVAGNHGVAGAAAGCAIGHHRAKKKAQEDQAAAQQNPQAANTSGSSGTNGTSNSGSAPAPAK
jgi:hypothetical protein